MKNREIHGESKMWSTAQRSTDLMFILGLRESIDQSAMPNNVHWYGHVLRREDGLLLRMALDLMVESQRKKGRQKRIQKTKVEEERMMVGLWREDTHCRSKWSVDVNLIAIRLT